MKNWITLICAVFSGIAMSQSQPYNESWTQSLNVKAQQIKLSCTYEGEILTDSGIKKSYTLSWEDTIGLNQYPTFNRPYELKVVVRDADTIAGQYTGLSTQFRHCGFVTNDDKVEVFFWMDRNLFYQPPQVETTNKRGQTKADSLEIVITVIKPLILERMDYFRSEYEPIKISLKMDAQNIVDGLNEKEILLVGNPKIVTLNYINKGALNPDPMPRLGPNYRNIMPENRYLLNMNNGKIKKGSAWLFWRGIRYCSHIDFRIVDPHLKYKTRDGGFVSGKELIKLRRVPKFVDPDSFRTLANSLPY